MTESRSGEEEEGPADGGAERHPGHHDGGADGGADSGADLDLEAAEDGRGAAEPGVVGGV